jgi:hypothetical protein
MNTLDGSEFAFEIGTAGEWDDSWNALCDLDFDSALFSAQLNGEDVSNAPPAATCLDEQFTWCGTGRDGYLTQAFTFAPHTAQPPQAHPSAEGSYQAKPINTRSQTLNGEGGRPANIIAQHSDNSPAVPLMPPNKNPGKFAPRQTRCLNEWLSKNISYPYADQQATAELAAATGLTSHQVKRWLNRARQRKLAPMQDDARGADGSLAKQTQSLRNSEPPLEARSPRLEAQWSQPEAQSSLAVVATYATSYDGAQDMLGLENMSVDSRDASQTTSSLFEHCGSMLEWWFEQLPNFNGAPKPHYAQIPRFWQRQLKNCAKKLYDIGYKMERAWTYEDQRAFLRLVLLLDLDVTKLMACVKTLEHACGLLPHTLWCMLRSTLNNLDTSAVPPEGMDEVKATLLQTLQPMFEQIRPSVTSGLFKDTVNDTVSWAIQSNLAGWVDGLADWIKAAEGWKLIAQIPDDRLSLPESSGSPGVLPVSLSASEWLEPPAIQPEHMDVSTPEIPREFLRGFRSEYRSPPVTKAALRYNRDNKSVASGSSSSSAQSGSSLASTRSRRGRRLWGPHVNCSPQHQGKYYCTFCGFVFSRKFAWKRHERTAHSQSETWVCTSEPSKPRPPCVFCFDIFCNHYPMSVRCWARSELDRTFYRKDEFLQHLRGMHNASVDCWAVQNPSHFFREENPSVELLMCGFCDHISASWNERADHVGNHFDEGMDLSSWSLPLAPVPITRTPTEEQMATD